MAVQTSLNDITDTQMNALENNQVINEIEFKEVIALKKIENHNTQKHPILIGYCDSDKSGTKLKSIEDVAKYIIEKGVSEDVRITHKDADLKGSYREAQVLCALGLFEFSDESDFTSSLVYCFKNSEDDEELVENINNTFGCDISYKEFQKIANSIHSTYINTAGYTDPTKKNNIDLCIWAEDALANGWGYVYGTFGTILSNSILGY